MQSAALALALLLVAPLALAQEAAPKEVTAEQALAAVPADVPQGWAFKLTVGGTGSYGHSDSVVGSVDGATVQLGLLGNGSATLTAGQSTWENLLGVNETQTRTPQLASFVKSKDELTLASTYLYRLPNLDWIGPFARAAATTQAFASYDLRNTDTEIVRSFVDGTTRSKVIPAGERIRLAKPFEPALVREGAGAFANPLRSDAVTMRTKLGLGLQHIFTRDGFALADDAATPVLEIKQLEDSTQGGAEAEAEVLGQFRDDITWQAKVNLFYPLYTSVDTALSGAELLSTDFSGKLSVRLAQWASLDYVLSAKRVPLVLDAWQVQNSLLLSASYDVL